jgi:predicted TIM-barrel fold metal-dependent hydrolase
MAVSPLSFVDTHHHLWDLEAFSYNWLEGDGTPSETAYLGEYGAIRKSYLIDDLLSDYTSCGIDVVKSVHVQADFSGPDPVVETAWLQSIADNHGYPHGIVAWSNLGSPDVEEELDRHLESPNMRGVRMIEYGFVIGSHEFRRGFHALVARNLSFDLAVDWDRLSDIVELLKGFPEARVIVTHTGDPYERTDAYFQRWKAGMATLAEFPNLVVKISGLGMRDREWTVDSIRPWILETIDIFGVDRCMFGTNWPVDRLYSDLPTLLRAYREVIAGFTHDEQSRLFRENAERYYSI